MGKVYIETSITLLSDKHDHRSIIYIIAAIQQFLSSSNSYLTNISSAIINLSWCIIRLSNCILHTNFHTKLIEIR